MKESESRNGVLWASDRRGKRWAKVGLLAAVSTGAIMTQPHLALGLPGHRALTWLALLLLMRLVGGPGWATAVGLASAVGTVAIGRSPDGSFWGVLQYVVAGFGVDAFLWVWPAIGKSLARMAVLGTGILVAVGWITPLGKGIFGGGADPHAVWLSITDVQPSAWVRLISFDTLFGAGAGVIAFGLVYGLSTLAARWRTEHDEALAPAVSRL